MDLFNEGGTAIKHQRQNILEQLKEYPFSFGMKGIATIKPKAYKSVRNHLRAELETGFKTSLQTARARNLLGFTLFQLGDHQEALEETNGVLGMEDQSKNIVSLANKAFMLCQLCDFEEAEEILEELHQLQADGEDFKYLLVKGAAELASSYLRFGPQFNMLAVRGFKEVIPHAKELEVWIWKLGLAVALRHALSLQHAPYMSKENKGEVTYKVALRNLQDIIDSRSRSHEGEETAALNNLKANAHAEMALLLRSTLNKDETTQLCFDVHTGPMASCKKALALDDNDASVLWKTGKVYRHYKDASSSKKLLEKAVKLQPSSAAFHHLGLTYKALATNSMHGKWRTQRGGKREKRRKAAKARKLMDNDDPTHAPVACGGQRTDGVTQRVKKVVNTTDQIRKAVKSPNNKITYFNQATESLLRSNNVDKKDDYVRLAITNLEKAVDFSEGENSRAVYDLALMYKANNEYASALTNLKKITQRQNEDMFTAPGRLEQITALEQTALFYQSTVRRETNQMPQKSRKMFYLALSAASEFFSSVPMVRNIFEKIFHSPSALLKDAETSNDSEETKLMTKSKIHRLMNNTKKSLSLLGQIDQEKHDEHFCKLRLESLAEEPEKAADWLAELELTGQKSKVKALYQQECGDEKAFTKIYFRAARAALQNGQPGNGPYFRLAFREAVPPPPSSPVAVPEETQGSMAAGDTCRGAENLAVPEPNIHSADKKKSSLAETEVSFSRPSMAASASIAPVAATGDVCMKPDEVFFSGTDNSVASTAAASGICRNPDVACAAVGGASRQEDACPYFDVMFLHDDDDSLVENNALKLVAVLESLGLKVVKFHDNCLPGTDELDDIQKNMDLSRLIIVLPGREEMTEFFRRCISMAAQRESTMALLTEDVPMAVRTEVKKTLRCLLCPRELFAHNFTHTEPGNTAFNREVLRLFKFLTNIKEDEDVAPLLF